MLFVVDTSSLIVLQKLGWLEELSHPDDEFLCPPKVIQELKNNKKLLGWLNEGTIAITEVKKPMLISGISETDVEVVSLAIEKSGSILSEDLLLRKKAEKLRIAAFNVPELIVLYYQHDRIDQHTCITRLEKLVAATALSKAVYRKLLEIIKQ
ncbi:hypothetical protein L0337_33975 [candidate division KSB1 bacterium]|nr:hypothetical protein [candidate division KSB1 bacterium]